MPPQIENKKINPPVFIWVLLIIAGFSGAFQVYGLYAVRSSGSIDPGSGGGNGILPYKSGVRGTVTIGPTCPVMREPPDLQCADKPYQASLRIRNAAGAKRTVIESKINADGTFEFSLPPGEYTIENALGSVMPTLSPVNVTVGPNSYTETNLQFDSGIR